MTKPVIADTGVSVIYSRSNDKRHADGPTRVQAAVLSTADRRDAENKQRYY